MRPWLAGTIAVWLCGLGVPLCAVQSGGPADAAGFVAQATAAAARYGDPAAAAADGYRPVGPDFPSMGQHWISAGLLVSGALDVTRPPILEYAELQGRLTLVGVAYAALTLDGKAPPAFPVPTGVWHFHAGTLETESFVSSHAGAGHEGRGPRVAVLHVWVGLANPDGVFSAENWALPYARFGYAVPPSALPGVARALALAAGSGYVDALLQVVGRPDSGEAAALREVVHRSRAGVLAILAPVQRRPVLDAADEARLAQSWNELWDSLRRTASPAVWARLEPYIGR